MVTILACIFTFGILITVHELGHFIAAKMMKMRVDEFAIGFGPKIYSTQEGETTYTLRALPLGGYNKIAGMDPDEEVDERGFKSKSIPARMFVILAGSLMNFLLPMILFFGLFTINGVEKPLNEPVLGQVIDGYAAAKSGLLDGDRVLTVDGKPVTTWQEVREQVGKSEGKEISIVVERRSEERTFKVIPEVHPETGRAMIGVVASTVLERVGPVEALKLSVNAEINIVKNMIASLMKIVTGNSSADVAGPIGVAKMAGEVANRGIAQLLQFVALLSLNLAIINLLPLPALDGGHFVILIVEALRGKPLSDNIMYKIQMAGVILILAITFFSTYKDITR